MTAIYFTRHQKRQLVTEATTFTETLQNYLIKKVPLILFETSLSLPSNILSNFTKTMFFIRNMVYML